LDWLCLSAGFSRSAGPGAITVRIKPYAFSAAARADFAVRKQIYST
jgi:hypothetical protein